MTSWIKEAVLSRDMWRCQRCGRAGTDHHHRRRRGIHSAHTDCRCNGILLCRACHQWAHTHPQQARETGYIISSYDAQPWKTPVQTIDGVRWYDCNGLTYNGPTDPYRKANLQ